MLGGYLRETLQESAGNHSGLAGAVLGALGHFLEYKVSDGVVLVRSVEMLLNFDGGRNGPAVAAAVEHVVPFGAIKKAPQMGACFGAGHSRLRLLVEGDVAVEHVARLQQQSATAGSFVCFCCCLCGFDWLMLREGAAVT